MNAITYKEFGRNGSAHIPWACLLGPEAGLTHYHQAVLNQPFTRKRFRRAGVFRFLGPISENPFAHDIGMRCLDMPIKMPGSEYRLPVEFGQWSEVITMAVSHQHTHNPEVSDFYAYLTVDQKPVLSGKSQRKAGLHVDGYQGARISPKVASDRSYICASCLPPVIHNQSFPIEDMDDSKENVFHAFDRMAHPSSLIVAPALNLVFMDCYTVHGVQVADKDMSRTFFRLSYSVRQYDRLGNSHNHLFDYNWPMFDRSIHNTLLP